MTETSNTWKMSIDESLILGPLLLFRDPMDCIIKFVPLELTLCENDTCGDKTASFVTYSMI